MKSQVVYRASFYAMLAVASMVLVGDWTADRTGPAYPIMVVAAGIAAFFLVDRARLLLLPRQLGDALGVATLAYFYYEYQSDESELTRALGHWLIHLQIIKYFLAKTSRDDWVLFLLGLTQVLIGAVVNQSDQIGAWIFLWAMLAVWVLGQFFLQREARRAIAIVADLAAGDEPALSAADCYPGLYDLRYAVDTVRVMISTLALGGLIFLALPRQSSAVRSPSGAPLARHLTGFDDEVKLGQLGEILENDSVVMTVELSDAEGRTLNPERELLWRGATLLRYEKTRWLRQSQRPTETIESAAIIRPGRINRQIHQRIKLEPIDMSMLFALRPIESWGTKTASAPSMNPLDGTLTRPDTRGGTYDYTVVSRADPDAIQVGEAPPSFARHEQMLSMHQKLKAALRPIALKVVAGLPEGKDRTSVAARAHALEAYLRDSGLFSYSLKMAVVDPNLDPVEDFLLNRRQGHCEYFASALALLLRSIDIPSRIVNGFKGGDWNDITQTLNVRQKHAHSWVEAYAGVETFTSMDRPEKDVPVWITLDPTPADQRDQSIAQVGGVAGNFRSITDVFRHIWVFYIVGYDGDRQNRILYEPMRQLYQEMRRQYMRLGRFVRGLFAALFHFRDPRALISVRGFFASFTILVAVLGFWILGAWLVRRWLGWLRGPGSDSASWSAGVLFYRRLAQMLAAYRLERGQAETQREFAARAAQFLSARGPATAPLADTPRMVVDAFYSVWFGQLELDPKALEELDLRLDQLEVALKNP